MRLNAVECDQQRRPSQLEELCREYPRLDWCTVRAIMRRYPGASDQELRRQIRRWVDAWEARQ